MIDIVRYREMLLEIRQRVNVRSEKPIEGIILAVREGHLQKKLKDAQGKKWMRKSCSIMRCCNVLWSW